MLLSDSVEELLGACELGKGSVGINRQRSEQSHRLAPQVR